MVQQGIPLAFSKYKECSIYIDFELTFHVSYRRGSVAFLSTYPGDPTTPGYPSKKGSPRTEKRNLPRIPSLPISWIEAQVLLQALNGHGIASKDVGRANWMGAIPGVDYNTGPARNMKLSMSNIMEDKFAWIWNTIGIINGTSEDEVVVIGNHHDAWMIGGAGQLQSNPVFCKTTNVYSGPALRIRNIN